MTFHEWQDWCPLAFDWYNNRHHHEGIAYFTPSQVYRGEHLQLQRVRQRALDQFWKQHPERFVRGQPRAPSLGATIRGLDDAQFLAVAEAPASGAREV